MEHLKGLCEVLGLSLDEAVKGKPQEAVTAVEMKMLEAVRGMPPDKAEAWLALGTMLKSESLMLEGPKKEPDK